MNVHCTTRSAALLRGWFPWGTWGQRMRSVLLGIALLVAAISLIYWAYGRLSVTFYKPKHMITLSGKVQTQCVGRYLIDVPVELGGLGIHSSKFIFGLTENHRRVEMDVKGADYTRTQFEKDVRARVDDIKGERTDWGAPTLLAQEVIETSNGRALLLRYLDTGTKSSAIDHELHILVGTRYAILKTISYVPDPEPVTNEPWYTFIDPKPAEDRLRKIAMNIKGYTDATKAPEGFCMDGVVMNDKTMGYDIETALFDARVNRELLPRTEFSINMEGQYGNNHEETQFQRVDKVSAALAVEMLAAGWQVVELRRNTPKINGIPAREYVSATHVSNKVMFRGLAETALPKAQQSLQRPYFTFNFQVGNEMTEEAAPLDQDQTLKIWDTLLKTMRLSPANGGNRVDEKTGGLVPTTKVGQICPKSGVWEASLPVSHPSAPYLADAPQRFERVAAGSAMPEVYAKFMFQKTADADNAAITWTWIREA